MAQNQLLYDTELETGNVLRAGMLLPMQIPTSQPADGGQRLSQGQATKTLAVSNR